MEYSNLFIKYVKRRLFLLFIGLIFAPGIMLPGSIGKKDSSIAMINGENISIKLLQHFLQKNRSSVINQFTQKYNVTDYSDFWYSSYGDNEVPAEILKNSSLQDCFKVTVQMILARKKGVVKDISYEGFLQKLKESNLSRKQAALENKTLYGPVNFNEPAYYDYLFSLTVLELKKHLAGKDLDTSDKNIKAFYENKKLKLYCKKGSLNPFPFEDVRANVRFDYIDYQYDNLINALVKKANIKVNNELYKKIRVE